MEINDVTERIIGAAITVHRELGPGLLESTYEACLAFELIEQGLRVERQKELPVVYRGVFIDCGYRIDLLVEDVVIVEVKSSHNLLINFNVRVLTRGIKRMVNELKN